MFGTCLARLRILWYSGDRKYAARTVYAEGDGHL